MAHNTAPRSSFFSFLLLFFLLYQASVPDSFLFLFSFSHLFGLFGARLSIIIQTFSALSLLSLVHTQGSPDSFALLALLGIHVTALLISFISFFCLIRLARYFVLYRIFFFCSFRFVSFRFASSLTSLPLFLYLCSLRYVFIAIVSICLSALSLFFFFSL